MKRLLMGLLAASGGCGADESSSDSLGSFGSGVEPATDGGDEANGSGTSTTSDPSVPLDDGAPGASAGADEMTCGEARFVLAAEPPNVMLVLDKSGSMVTNGWDGDDNPATEAVTRWASLHSVVDLIVNGFDDVINFGANLFPSSSAIAELGAGACVVASLPEVPVAPNNGQAVLQGIPAAQAVDLQGATPATAGVKMALEHLSSLDPTVPRFMVLITDGAANCGAAGGHQGCPGIGCPLMEDYDRELPQVIASAFEDDSVPTFVVGIDIRDELVGEGDDGRVAANTFEELNVVADAGGRARQGDEKFFNTRNEIELESALEEIAGQVVSCIVPLTPEPTDVGFVEVEIGGETIPQVDNCDVENGWSFVEPQGPYDAIELCGTACDALADQGTLDATYGCPPAG